MGWERGALGVGGIGRKPLPRGRLDSSSPEMLGLVVPRRLLVAVRTGNCRDRTECSLLRRCSFQGSRSSMTSVADDEMTQQAKNVRGAPLKPSPIHRVCAAGVRSPLGTRLGGWSVEGDMVSLDGRGVCWVLVGDSS